MGLANSCKFAGAVLALLPLAGCLAGGIEGKRGAGVVDFTRELTENTRALLGDALNPLELKQCLAAALNNNLELKVAGLTAELAEKQSETALLDLYPQVPLRMEGTVRDKEPFSRSTYMVGQGGIRDAYATAQEHESFFFVAEMLWSPLDFGLAWYSARQAELEKQAEASIRMRVGQKLGGAVFSAYYRMQAAQAAIPLLTSALDDAAKRCANMEELRRERQATATQIGKVEEEAAIQREQIAVKMAGLVAARTELAQIMGINPTADFKVVADQERNLPNLPELSQLLRRSLELRPELAQADLKGEQARLELKKAWLRIFPNVQIFQSFSYDNNEHLFYKYYYLLGARMTVDLVSSLLSGSEREAAALQTKRLGQEMRLASMNILVQVRMSHLTLSRALSREAEAHAALQRAALRAHELNAQAKAGTRTGSEMRFGRMLELTARVDWLAARGETWVAYADLLTAVGSPLSTLAGGK